MEPDLRPTREELLAAIKVHMNETYWGSAPEFTADVELYQDAGLLPEDYEIPNEVELEETNYQLRKAGATLIKFMDNCMLDTGTDPKILAALAVFASRPPGDERKPDDSE